MQNPYFTTCKIAVDIADIYYHIDILLTWNLEM